MRKGYIASKRLVNWCGMLLTLLVFALDTLLGNVYKINASQDYVTQVYQYMSFKELFTLIPYILLIVISMNVSIKFDKFDLAVLFTCLFLSILNCVDFFVNYNWRPMWSDWVIFLIVLLPSLFLKHATYNHR